MAALLDLSPKLEELPTFPPTSTPTPFRFKSKKRSKSHSSEDTFIDPKCQKVPHRRHRRHRRHHHHHRIQKDPKIPPSPPIDPDTAFRESLFDALADDEGAAYWEGIYGQPIHIYSPYQHATATSSSEPNGLDRMTDEEYTTYVRAKMWEKSHGYILEERAKREEERKKAREEQKKERERMRDRKREAEAWEREGAEDSETSKGSGSRKRRERKEDRKWKDIWDHYLHKWEELRQLSIESVPSTTITSSTRTKPSIDLGKLIPYPVYTLKSNDVSRDAIELFMRNATRSHDDPNDKDGGSLRMVLKEERVRWHPDKIQQRYGHLGLDQGTTGLVTSVFQVVDRMWGELKGN